MTGRTARWLWSLMRKPARDQGPRLTIIRHHRVYRASERPFYRLGVGEDVLASQLDLLASAGLTPVTVSDGLSWLQSAGSGHRVALSFDDGYADNVHRVLPVLEKVGARATFYLTAGLIETRRAPWWDALAHWIERTRVPRIRWISNGEHLDLRLEGLSARRRALAALLPGLRSSPSVQDDKLSSLRVMLDVLDQPSCQLCTWEEATALARSGMEVGSHTMTHPYLSTLSREEQLAEIGESVDLIERRLGVRPAGVAYPDGDHDQVSVDSAAACGLTHAVTTQTGDNRPGQAALRLLRRGLSEGACMNPMGRFSLRLAAAELQGAFDGMRRVRMS